MHPVLEGAVGSGIGSCLQMAAMATMAGMTIRAKAHWLGNDRAGLNYSRTKWCSRLSRAGKPFCGSIQWAGMTRQSGHHRSHCHALQVTAIGEDAEERSENIAVKSEEMKEELDVSVEKKEGTAVQVEEKKAVTEEYSAAMQQAMGTSLEYRHELGMNYAFVLPDLIVGSCLQTPLDADKLKGIGVGVIFCLQQNPDLAYFGVDLPAIQARVNELDGITHYRCRIRDFDPYDLRLRLPVAVAQLQRAIEAHKSKTAYVHCTAGLGRAPAVALAFMYWLRGLSLKEANVLLQKVRRCHPKLDSIRAATVDLLIDRPKQVVELKWWSGPTTVEIAGLDVGWGNQRLPLEFRQNENQWILRREVPAGRYEYKYVVDGVWMTNSESPLSHRNGEGQVNNVLEIVDSAQNEGIKSLQHRLMQEDADLTTEERAKIRSKLEQIANSGQW